MTREEAIKELRGFIGQLTEGCQEAIKVLIPELAESEDERIIEQLLYIVKDYQVYAPKSGLGFKECHDWLEKQKETITSKTKDYTIANDYTSAYYEERGYKNGYADGVRDTKAAIAKSPVEQKPAEWSEEDEKMIERLITRLNWITYNTRTDGTSPNITFFDEIDWLKSLRPSWKPSEEQMKALYNFAYTNFFGDGDCDALRSLYEDLKKL